jgi:pimeloyl-ACP methyl ester carboxylesterase
MTRRCRVACVLAGLLASATLAGCNGGSSDATPGPAANDSNTASEATTTPNPTTSNAAPTPAEVLPVDTCRGDVCSTAELASWTDVPFTPEVACDDLGATCQLTMDVLAPTAPGTRPIVLLVSGGPNPLTNQGYVMDAGFPVAVHDAVVIHAVWRQDQDQGGGWPTSFQDIACAVGVARAIGPDYGGDPGRVVLVGHSLGGWASAVVALSPTEVAPAPGACNPTSGSLRPDALVTLAGAVDLDERGPGRQDFLRGFFAGSRAQRPQRWAQSDPFVLAAAKKHGQVPVTVVHGTADITVAPAVARAFAKALRHNGIDTRLVEVPEADHSYVLVAPAATDAIVAATDATEAT